MLVPFVPGFVAHGDSEDDNLTEVCAYRGLGADGSEERVPAVGDVGGVEESEV